MGFLKKLFGKKEEISNSSVSTHSTKRALTVIPFADGRVYTGELISIIPDGHGKITFPNGNVYEGEFRNGIPDGQMTVTMSNGDFYEGDMKAGLKCGKGKYVWISGEEYIGEWADDKRNGQGQLSSRSEEHTSELQSPDHLV